MFFSLSDNYWSRSGGCDKGMKLYLYKSTIQPQIYLVMSGLVLLAATWKF